MSLGNTQELLFGAMPRRVGTPAQGWVWSQDQLELFVAGVNGRRNAYSTVGWMSSDGSAMCDKVLYDLDSPAKSDQPGERWSIYVDDPADDVVLSEMREDSKLAEDILGKPVAEARRLAQRSREEGVPVVGVFSGLGVHVHQLYRAESEPSVKMATTAHRYIDRLGLDTADHEIIGEPERICRVPNCERVAGTIADNRVVDGRRTGTYTVPLNGAEMLDMTVRGLLDKSTSPRPQVAHDASERPEMRLWPDYETGHETTSEVPPRPVNPEGIDVYHDEDFRALMEDLLKMPCMAQRLLDDPNPDHKIRANATVLLLNVGLEPSDVVDLFESVGWVDWDRDETVKQVRSVHRNGYSDMSCKSLRQQGYCVQDEPEECSCYGWRDGRPEWIQ